MSSDIMFIFALLYMTYLLRLCSWSCQIILFAITLEELHPIMAICKYTN